MSPYVYNSSNQLTSTPAATYTYDKNGNTKTKVDASGTTTYNWNTLNQLTSVVLPGTGGTVSFKYDPFGSRVQKSSQSGTTNYLYSGAADLIEAVDQSGNVLARYSQGPLFDEPLSELIGGTDSYFQADALGTVTSLSTSAGALGSTYTYDSFGKLTASSGALTNPFQYTGREFDPETGLFYDRARYYDPATGRFVSEDPLGFEAGVNFYPYVRNNPVLHTDPSGKNPGAAVALAPVAAGGGISGWMLTGSSAGPIGALIGLNVGLVINDSIGVYDLGVASGWWGQPKPKPECKSNNDDRCKKVREECSETCWEQVQRMRVLPQDRPGLLRKCIRKCMNDQGCYDF